MSIDINCDECSCGIEASADIICYPCYEALRCKFETAIEEYLREKRELQDKIATLTRDLAGV